MTGLHWLMWSCACLKWHCSTQPHTLDSNHRCTPAETTTARVRYGNCWLTRWVDCNRQHSLLSLLLQLLLILLFWHLTVIITTTTTRNVQPMHKSLHKVMRWKRWLVWSWTCLRATTRPVNDTVASMTNLSSCGSMIAKLPLPHSYYVTCPKNDDWACPCRRALLHQINQKSTFVWICKSLTGSLRSTIEFEHGWARLRTVTVKVWWILMSSHYVLHCVRRVSGGRTCFPITWYSESRVIWMNSMHLWVPPIKDWKSRC